MHVLTRGQFERLKKTLLKAQGISAAQIERLLAAQYPTLTQQAILEARARGAMATEERAFGFAQAHRDVVVEHNGVFLWTAPAIDLFCQMLEKADCLTPEAQERADKKITAEDDLAVIEQHTQEQIAQRVSPN